MTNPARAMSCFGAPAAQPIALVVDEDDRSATAMESALAQRGYETIRIADSAALPPLTPAQYEAVRLATVSCMLASVIGDFLKLFPLLPVIAVGDEPPGGVAWPAGTAVQATLTRPIASTSLDAALQSCEKYSLVFDAVVRRKAFVLQNAFLEEPIARIVHDLNNQITGLKGGIDLLNYSIGLMQDRESQQKFSRYMEQFIQPSLAQIEYLIRTWRRMREDHAQPSTQVDLTQAARQAASLAFGPFHASQVRLCVGGREQPIYSDICDPGDTALVFANRDHLVTALARILENAREAVENIDDGRVEIAISAAGDGMYCVSIVDNGQGIDPEIRRQVFRSFFTTKTGGHIGLGLSIAKQLIDKHQGQIECTDSPLGGAGIRILFPATVSDENGFAGE